MKKMNTFTQSLIGASLLSIFAGSASAMVITDFDSADNMAQSLAGDGVVISNASYTGANSASGYFTDGLASGLGFDSGIVLTTGAANSVNGTTNTSDATSVSNGTAGDAFLSTLSGQQTYDAALLSFDFTSDKDSAFFNYAFGSEEYSEFVDSYNDVFAFIFESENIAVIPNTDIPVSINTINDEDNSNYYNSNEAGEFAFEYDGFTNMLTASISGLVIGETYRITLAIADAGDSALDSGVFIQAASFSDQPVDVPEPAPLFLLGSGLLMMLSRRLRKS
ncbi:choice-of-anchor L family PEP-CTERM protein [Corallincola luteus]|nr:choice-of-anchor L domain-containing protein [Corallincola luteus]